MEFNKEIKQILKEIKNAKFDETNTLTNNAYFLKDSILLKENKNGDARYPYVRDGRALWVHQNGNISFNESNYFIISDALEGEKNFLSFFLGIKKGDEFLPVSLFDINKNLFEKNVNRYTIFKDSHAVFILEVEKIIYALRITTSENKNLIYELCIKNTAKTKKNVYSSMFFNFNMTHSNHSTVETKWFKKSTYANNQFKLETVEDISRYEFINNTLYLNRYASKNISTHNATSRGVYCGSKTGYPENSKCLLKGNFDINKNITCFSDTSIAGDILPFGLEPNEEVTLGYILKENNEYISLSEIDNAFDEVIIDKNKYYSRSKFIEMTFEGEGKVNGKLFSRFINEVAKQVDYCATTKNSTLTMLGIRDVFQAIEAGLIWNPNVAKKKILEALNYVSIEGRLPRQYSLPVKGQNIACVDDRLFIDQGLWVIDCLYQYLSYTNDSSILKSKCSYAEFDNKGKVTFLKKKDSVMSHLYAIMNFLINNIDKNTHCLKTLYGDWNDAVDGLGKSRHYEGFGNGVSAMATFQLYSSLNKMIEIIQKYDTGNKETLSLYVNKKDEIVNGINSKVFEEKDHEFKIIHGWGNDESFKVGSFSDVDLKSRDSLTSNAFYILSGFYKVNDKYISSVKDAYTRLDSKFGFKTFEPFFDKDAEEVGRIINLPKGTAENAATYIHGTVFALDSLFVIDEPKWAFEQIFKIIPITHKFISTTPFIMPNSYIHNEEIDVDGESMNDWFTGSSSTLIKSFIRNVFGINVTLDKVIIQTSKYFPYENSRIKLKICGNDFVLNHISDGGVRKIIFNGSELELRSEFYRKEIAIIDKSSLQKSNEVTVYN